MNAGAELPLRDVLALDVHEEFVAHDDMYQVAGVYGFGRGLFGRGPIYGSDTSYKKLNVLRAGHLVVSRLKAFEGALAIVPDEFDGWFVSPEFPTFRCKEDQLDPRYLAHVCHWPEFWAMLAATSKGIGARRERVHPGDLLSLKLRLPSIEEQRNVSARLDRLRDKVAALVHRLDLASQLINALTISMSARPDLDDDAKRRAGWRRAALGEVLQMNNDETLVEPSISYSVAGVYSFGRGVFARTTLDGSQTSYKMLHRLHAGQLVMSRLKAWEGALAVVPTDLDGWFVSPEFPTFDIDDRQVDPRYLDAVLTTERFWARLKGASQGIGARRERVSASRLLEQEIKLPPFEEQQSIARRIDRLRRARVQHEQGMERIGSLVPAALNQEFAGLR
jgi:type I restriction enzyme, S subunit